MTRSRLSMVFVLAVVLGVAAIPLRASDMVGVYCLIQKVALEPNETEPQSIQITGACALADGQRGDGYQSAQRGYLYYVCPKDKDSTCHSEWADLKSVAGKDVVVGFGGRFMQNGRLRQIGERPVSPDTYPIQMGVMRLGHYPATNRPVFIQQLKDALSKK